jgi:holo-[acyl-carrier protein] synthase
MYCTTILNVYKIKYLIFSICNRIKYLTNFLLKDKKIFDNPGNLGMVDSGIDIGTDIVEIKRFRQKPLEANLTFYNSIFTKSELIYCVKYADPYPHLAGIYAAKESIIKCSSRSLRMHDIEIIRCNDGKPVAVICYKKKNTNVKISISHTRSIAMAVAIIFDNNSSPG